MASAAGFVNKIKQFCANSGVDEETARWYLEAAADDLDLALSLLLFDDPPSESTKRSFTPQGLTPFNDRRVARSGTLFQRQLDRDCPGAPGESFLDPRVLATYSPVSDNESVESDVHNHRGKLPVKPMFRRAIELPLEPTNRPNPLPVALGSPPQAQTSEGWRPPFVPKLTLSEAPNVIAPGTGTALQEDDEPIFFSDSEDPDLFCGYSDSEEGPDPPVSRP
jgi:hypothetical protein